MEGGNPNDPATLQARIAELTAALNRQNDVVDPNRPLKEYTAPRADGIQFGYMVPNIMAEEYQIPPGWLNSIQRTLFHGLPHEDAVQHLTNFNELCGTLKIRTLNPDDLKRMTFIFTLAERAKNWMRNQRPENMDTWAKISNAFLNQFFPPGKTDGIRHQIHNFRQTHDETLASAWERFNELRRGCPHHGIQEWSLLRIFYGGLCNQDRLLLDAAAGGSLCNRAIDEGFKLIDDMALNQTQYHKPREDPAYMHAKMNNMQGNDHLLKEIAALNKKIDGLSVNSVNSNLAISSHQFSPCSFCGGSDHLSVNCGGAVTYEGGYEEVNAINQGNFRPNNNNNPYSNTYNPGWRNHPNFSWRTNDQSNQNQGNQGGQYQNRGQQGQGYNQNRGNQNWGNQGSGGDFNAGNSQPSSKIENMLEAFMRSQKQEMEELRTRVELLATQNKLLETQVAQQATSSTRPPGMLPPKPDMNPKDVKAIRHVLRSGTTYDDPPMPNEDVAKESKEEEQQGNDELISTTEVEASKDSPGSSKPKDGPVKVSTEVPLYVPPHRYAPFPSRLKNDGKIEKQFSKFIEVLKQLHINLPLTEVITQMPIYAKFFKDILSNRRKLEEVQVVSLTNLPKKLDDPGKFSIPCAIGNVQFKQALCDLGASVSLMPKLIFEKIGVGELKPTRISLQMADQSVKLPIGVVEDMPVQIGRYFVPIDFVIVEMEEDTQTPLLLGRPFLNTAKAIIDVHEGMISFKIGDDKVTFDVNRALKYPSNENSIFRVDSVEELAQEGIRKNSPREVYAAETMPDFAETSDTSPDETPKVEVIEKLPPPISDKGSKLQNYIFLRSANNSCGPQIQHFRSQSMKTHFFTPLRAARIYCGPQESNSSGNNKGRAPSFPFSSFKPLSCNPPLLRPSPGRPKPIRHHFPTPLLLLYPNLLSNPSFSSSFTPFPQTLSPSHHHHRRRHRAASESITAAATGRPPSIPMLTLCELSHSFLSLVFFRLFELQRGRCNRISVGEG